MNKIEEIKNKIEELKSQIVDAKDEIRSKNKLQLELEKQLSHEMNRNFIDFCKTCMPGKYFQHTYINKEYMYDWYIYVDNVEGSKDEDEFKLYGRSIMLVHNNDAEKKLVTVTIDKDSRYFITNGWKDSLSGYFDYKLLTKITEEEFNKHKEKIKEIII